MINDINKEWQRKICSGCIFAEKELVGTGKPCCTYPGKPRITEEGNCLNYRKE